jgi:hypothetical protein
VALLVTVAEMQHIVAIGVQAEAVAVAQWDRLTLELPQFQQVEQRTL